MIRPHEFRGIFIFFYFLLQVTTKGDRFLLYDSGAEADRMIIFATPANLDILGRSEEWFLDGTFKVCPSIFSQLYTVHAKLPHGGAVPVLYALLPANNTETYRRFLTVLKEHLNGHEPQVVHMDFEKAMIKELDRAFPDVRIIGCNFHFNQCLYRRIQSDGPLHEKYLQDQDFALGVRMFAALAFVPWQANRWAFSVLLESPFVRNNRTILRSFINYFESTWVGRSLNPARFDARLWDAHEATVAGIARTNNHVEGWHAAFAGRVGCAHPTVFKFIESLKCEQGLIEFVITNSQSQGVANQSKRVYRDRQKRLFNLVSVYDDNSVLHFLGSVAHNITFRESLGSSEARSSPETRETLKVTRFLVKEKR